MMMELEKKKLTRKPIVLCYFGLLSIYASARRLTIISSSKHTYKSNMIGSSEQLRQIPPPERECNRQTNMARHHFIVALILTVVNYCNAQGVVPSNTAAKNDSVSPKKVFPDQTIIDIGLSRYIFQHKSRVNWFTAFGACRQNKSSLATIDSTQVMTKFNDHLRARNKHQDYWISVNTLQNRYEFVPHFSAKGLNYTKWHEGEPDFRNPKAHCVAIIFDETLMEYFWHHIDCDTQLNYICEIPKPQPVPYQSHTNEKTSVEDKKWVQNVKNFFEKVFE